MQKNEVVVVQGEDRTISMQIKTSDDEPYDLTGATEINCKFKKSDRTVLEKKLSASAVTVTEAKLGKLTTTLSDSESALLKTGERQTFEVVIDKGSARRIVQFSSMLNVRALAVTT